MGRRVLSVRMGRAGYLQERITAKPRTCATARPQLAKADTAFKAHPLVTECCLALPQGRPYSGFPAPAATTPLNASLRLPWRSGGEAGGGQTAAVQGYRRLTSTSGCFTPDSGHAAHRLGCRLRANRVIWHRSKTGRYSITSSARASSAGGTSRPSIRAVWALMTNSNLVDCTTGRSAGFAPLRMRPV
jgi:hypothetical protein